MNAAGTQQLDAFDLPAPAKVNLRLEVRGRRDDGYHELCTVMMAVGVTDRLRFSAGPAAGLELSVSDPALSQDNLVRRAWERFAGHTAVRGGVRIELTKRIPAGAGLGGGSSDAAAALIGLDRFFGTDLDAATLAELGGEIGSDVPFFLAAASLAVCRGRGERVEPIDSPADCVGCLVVPPFACRTSAVYAEHDRLSASSPAGPSASTCGAFADAVDAWPAQMHNDLEPAALRLEPRLREIRASLEALEPWGLVMTGSGSGFFCLCRDESDASRIQRAARDRNLGAACLVHRWRAAPAKTTDGG